MIKLSRLRSPGRQKSMCFAATGRLQGRAAKLLRARRKSWYSGHLGQICLAANVRRYVALPQSRGGACFCTRGAMQDYNFVLFILALAKTVTPAGVPGGSRGGPYRRPPNSPL